MDEFQQELDECLVVDVLLEDSTEINGHAYKNPINRGCNGCGKVYKMERRNNK